MVRMVYYILGAAGEDGTGPVGADVGRRGRSVEKVVTQQAQSWGRRVFCEKQKEGETKETNHENKGMEE